MDKIEFDLRLWECYGTGNAFAVAANREQAAAICKRDLGWVPGCIFQSDQVKLYKEMGGEWRTMALEVIKNDQGA